MKKENLKRTLIIMFLFVVFVTITASAQNYSNDPKTISVMPTESKSMEIKIKNESSIPEVFIIYKHDNTQKYWDKIGSVSVFQMTEAKFYVEKGFTYGFNIEGKRPIKLGSDEQWEVRKGD